MASRLQDPLRQSCRVSENGVHCTGHISGENCVYMFNQWIEGYSYPCFAQTQVVM